MTLRCLLALTVLALAAQCSLAEELLPADRPIYEVVDHYIDAVLAEEGVEPAPAASDHNVLRRTMLDLVGRIPTAAEARAYAESTDPNKRAALVERLVGSPAYARAQAYQFDLMLMGKSRSSMRHYLEAAFAENRPWDQIFREVMLARSPDDPKQASDAQKEVAAFVKDRVGDLDRLTAESSAIFFGVNISCAQCHDHPEVFDWKQDHFYGMKSFFNRTREVGGFIAESRYGVVKFKTTSGEGRDAKLMFLTNTVLEDPTAAEASDNDRTEEKEWFEQFAKRKQPPPPPEFSRRAALVDVALRPGERDFFARSVVNRLWHRLLGHGLVMPLDQMHSENPPSHPELLAWLARDLVEHNYDLRRLTQGLVLSRAYARSSQWKSDQRPPEYLFAVAAARALAPLPYAASLRIAAASPEQLNSDVSPDELAKRIDNLENSARGLANLFDVPGDRFQIGVGEALAASNGEQFERDLLADNPDRLVGFCKKSDDPSQLVEALFWNILSRPPDEEESQALTEYITARADRPLDAYRQVVWALLTSTEFRMNY